MRKLIEKSLKKKGVGKLKKLSNNKGFSLVELLIVIAIMGVLAVIAFNMFGGVLQNSKKRADAQQARNIEKAIVTYCIDSGDWRLGGTVSGSAIGNGSSQKLIEGLLEVVTFDGETYGPILTPKDPEKSAAENAKELMPQWNESSGGKYVGWKIDVYPEKQTAKVTPSTTSGTGINVAIH